MGASDVTASVSVKTDKSVSVQMIIAHYSADGTVKGIEISEHTIVTDGEYSVTYDNAEFADGDYVKAFLWDGIDTMKPLTTAKILS